MITIIYRLIVLYFFIHIVVYLFRKERLWDRLGAVVVLALFLLRLLLVK